VDVGAEARPAEPEAADGQQPAGDHGAREALLRRHGALPDDLQLAVLAREQHVEAGTKRRADQHADERQRCQPEAEAVDLLEDDRQALEQAVEQPVDLRGKSQQGPHGVARADSPPRGRS